MNKKETKKHVTIDSVIIVTARFSTARKGITFFFFFLVKLKVTHKKF
jgi:hypothetical protein